MPLEFLYHGTAPAIFTYSATRTGKLYLHDARRQDSFAVIPYAEYILLFPATKRIPDGDALPQEVVSLMVDNDWSNIRAWREYLGLTFYV